MPFTHILILAAVQGITEFLPISSSGHLILVPKLTGLNDQGLILDVAVHVGTLLAVMLYFWRDMFNIMRSIIRVPRQVINKSNFDPEFWIFCKLLLATIPVIVVGYIINTYLVSNLLTIEIVGWTTLTFGLLLYIADKINMTVRKIQHISFKGAIFIGLFQVLALIPGTSRAGITMTAARFIGVERQDAARFSMLLSIPVIIGAAGLKGYELIASGDKPLLNDALIVIGFAFFFALLAISFLMIWLKRANFTPFVIYRVFLGIAL